MYRLPAVLVAVAAIALTACAPPRAPAPKAAATVVAKPQLQATTIRKPRVSAFQETLDTLGVPLRVHQWGKSILVNIPSYELIALEDGEEKFRMRVIVGAPGGERETPVIDTFTSVARFRPTWTPTPTMIRTGAYEPGTRPPGRGNPLGYVALRFDDGQLVYLHDTNKPRLFERDRRALSWGCVRVDGIERLVAWALDMDEADVLSLMHGRGTVDVQTTGLPVMLRYYTAFPDAGGNLRQFDDIYRRGETVLTPKPRAPVVAAKRLQSAG